MSVSNTDLADSASLDIARREIEGIKDLIAFFLNIQPSEIYAITIVNRDQTVNHGNRVASIEVPIQIDETDKNVLIVNSFDPASLSDELKDAYVTNLKDDFLPDQQASKETEFNSLRNDLRTFKVTLADASGFTIGNTVNQTTGNAASGEIKDINVNTLTVNRFTELAFEVGETLEEGANSSQITAIE